MFHITGIESVIETVMLLSNQYRHGDTVKALHRSLADYLHAAQPEMPQSSSNHPRFTADPLVVDALLPIYRVQCELNDLDQERVIGEKFTDYSSRLAEIENIVKEMFVGCDNLLPVFSMVTSHVFCAEPSEPGLAYAGTTSAAIGTMWTTPLYGLPDIDIAEIFLHELTHNLVHLDELRHELYIKGALHQVAHYSKSAILKRNRPLDKTYHSLIVATEVLLFRERYVGHALGQIIHPQSWQLCLDARNTADSLRRCHDQYDVLTTHSMGIVDTCVSNLEALQERIAA